MPKAKSSAKPSMFFGDKNDVWKTPTDLYEALDAKYSFDFDPCPLEPDFNGLEVEWGESNFVNPPYSEIPKWIKKGIAEMKEGRKSVFLITARTNTKYWSEYVFPYAHKIMFIRGKVKFSEKYREGLAIPLAIVVFDPDTSTVRKDKQIGPYKVWKY